MIRWLSSFKTIRFSPIFAPFACFVVVFPGPTVRVLNIVAYAEATVALPGAVVERKAERFRRPVDQVADWLSSMSLLTFGAERDVKCRR
jgi:hypothetical protein